jgi:hypothetical protein
MTPERWREIERLYHAAPDRDLESRDDFLAAAVDLLHGARQTAAAIRAHPATLLVAAATLTVGAFW